MRRFVAFTLIASGLLFAILRMAAPRDAIMPRLTTGDDVCDYRVFIRRCLTEKEPYRPKEINAHDACYPALAYCLVRCFPQTPFGEKLYVGSLFAGLAFGFCVFLWSRARTVAGLCLTAVILTVPFASGPLRGNPSAWACGAVCVFLSWYDAERKWQRIVATVALAFAVALKITPAAYGLLYLRSRLFSPRKWPSHEIVVALVAFAILFVVPFAFFGGVGEIGIWLHNALFNSEYYSRVANFGFIDIFWSFCNHLPTTAYWYCLYLTPCFAILLILASCFSQSFYHALNLLGVAMVLLCHHDYGLVYLLPAFARWMNDVQTATSDARKREIAAPAEAILWLVAFQSFGCVFSKESIWLSSNLRNVAVLLLGIISCVHVVTHSAPGISSHG